MVGCKSMRRLFSYSSLCLLIGCASSPVLPLPKETPYDTNAKERASYLRAFARGYQFGWNGSWVDGWGLVNTGPPPRRVRIDEDGRNAGSEAGVAARRAYTRELARQLTR